jgi:transcription elongation GreA/GreB family factor
VGSALLGKAVGDVIDVNVPKGLIKVKVLKID